MLFPVILKIYGTAKKLIILKSCLNFGAIIYIRQKVP